MQGVRRKLSASKLSAAAVPDIWMLFSIYLLLAVGLAMVYSATNAITQRHNVDDLYFLRWQLAASLIGSAILFLFVFIDITVIRKYARVLVLGILFLLVLVFIKPIGREANGALRWIAWPIRFQPSAFAPLILIIYLADVLSRKSNQLKDFKYGILPPLIITLVMVILLLLEPDFSSSVFIFLIATLMFFIAGAPIWYFLLNIAAMIISFIVLLNLSPGRLGRIRAWFDPGAYSQTSGYGILRSLSAIHHGGMFGVGIHNSALAGQGIPEAHTDFIFSVIGETLGLWGMIFIIGLFIILCWRGVLIAQRQKDQFNFLLASGIVIFIALAAIINIGVCINLLPTTGLPLPLVSYGRTSLVAVLIALGILLHLSRTIQSERVH